MQWFDRMRKRIGMSVLGGTPFYDGIGGGRGGGGHLRRTGRRRGRHHRAGLVGRKHERVALRRQGLDRKRCEQVDIGGGDAAVDVARDRRPPHIADGVGGAADPDSGARTSCSGAGTGACCQLTGQRGGCTCCGARLARIC